MHLCFVDESGTPPSKPNSRSPYFTLGAIIIEATDWRGVANDVQGFCTSNSILGELKWRYFSPHNRDKDNPMLTRSPEERKALSTTLANIIASSPVTVIATVTDVAAAFDYGTVSNQQELYHFAYKPLSERFQYYLQDKKSLGVVIADHRGRDNDRLFRAHHDGLTGGTRSSTISKYNRFIEGLFLQDSCHSIGIQLADFVAGAIHRAYSTEDGRLAAVLKPKVRKRPDGSIKGHGIVHHPKDKFRPGLCRSR
ncbi:DUF3800 domain-containing protein [Salipiger sp. PrR003]|uniref:DUF3800 domain-containing protein n=1 Tax=Salipiger sp. PrR003 TaxID=2706776 RepID=UPI0013DBDF06|nr:DUF3800 domain-containing protein [Salipiger sp. PrR003]